jgi:organic hydroperoxide reductase OsmC/OhrA
MEPKFTQENTMNLEHHYATNIEWAGNRGTGTSGYKDYGRETVITATGKQSIDGSADRVFHGDAERWNPEELLLAALSECHLLSYLHVAASNGVTVTGYTDAATGTLVQTADGGGHFSTVTLRPRVTIAGGDAALALALHHEASTKCFIAASVNFPVLHEPEILVVPQ